MRTQHPRAYPTLCGLALALAACGPGPDADVLPEAPTRPAPATRADTIAFAAIDSAGGWLLDSSTVSFRFRESAFGLDRHGGRYVYTRDFVDTLGDRILDVLTDGQLTRRTNDRPTTLTPKQSRAARESLNSVIYFAFLPRWLADDAAVRTYEGRDTLRGRPYHRIRVTFEERGGGSDFRDQFLYWFDVDDASLDFLAYSYETNEGGVRFREAFNTRIVGGLTVQDYRNYRAEPELSVPLEEMAEAWSKGRLELLSTVSLEDVQRG